MLDIVRNELDYPLRRIIRWRRKGLNLKNNDKETLLDELPDAERELAKEAAARLLNNYHLQSLYYRSSIRNYRINLYYLEMLERALSAIPVSLPDSIKVADIGASDWFYVHALSGICTWWNSPTGRIVNLFGYEADAYRVYADFYSRCDYAHAYAQKLRGVYYLTRDFTRERDSFHVITMLFPFIFLKDHLRWGLPLARFCPQKLIANAWESLIEGGILIISNQGEKESEAQQSMLKEAGITHTNVFRFSSLLYDYRAPHFVTVAIRGK